MSPSPAEQRARAARLLQQVVAQGRTTDQVMGEVPPLVQELLLGSLRHYFSLAAAVDAALHRPLQPRDTILRYLMIVGAYQLRFTRIPDHAALNETVNACGVLGRPWARGLVNAVLRRCAGTAAPDDTERSFEHPRWLEAALRAAYPDAEAIMRANNARAPMTLRINARRTSPEDYVTGLEAVGLHSRRAGAGSSADPDAVGLGAETRVLLEPCRSADLPGFGDGLVSVQDAGAQFAAALLAPSPGARVLDACAAPGGKLFHLAERYPEARLMGVDASGARLEQLKREAARLGHGGPTLLEGDATTLDWWDGISFDAVLLDAPCTGTGTLRRHPDAKVLRQREDVDAMAGLQQRLLERLWRVLQPGGTLLYCTCSMLPAENDEVIGAFLAGRQDVALSPFRLVTGRPTQHGWQLLPIDRDTDGFYYARMIKTTR